MAEISGGRVRGRPRLDWMDGVKVALGNRRMTVEAARQALPCSAGYHLESGGMPLHDAVLINWEKGACNY